jgi:RNA polymerase sigma factor (sigma-70 family)
LHAILNQLYGMPGCLPLEEASDGQLLERFLARRDEAAFGTLLNRHGPMVLNVCRRVLQHAQDTEDAFQATFLLLARSGGSIRKRESVASWLYGVAYRLAIKTRTRNARRQDREKQAVAMHQTGTKLEADWRELQTVLDEELHGLPAKYQAPLVLCYLEGKTHEEVARQLGLPLGTVRSRVARGREALRTRLARRGLTLSAAALATVLAANVSRAVSPRLLGITFQAALSYAASGVAPLGFVSPEAAALVEGGITAVTTTSVKLGLALLFVVGLGVASAGALAFRPRASDPPAPLSTPRKEKADPKPSRERKDGLPAGASARLGTARLWRGTGYLPSASLIFSPDGKAVALAEFDGAVHLWQVATGKKIARVAVGSGRIVSYFALSSDGKTLATVDPTGGVRLWNIPTNKEGKPLDGNRPGMAHACAFSPDGKVLASPERDGIVQRWNVATGKKLPVCKGHKGVVNAVAFSAKGGLLASGGDDQTVRLWGARGKQVRTLEGHRDKVIALAFTPDGKTLASRGTDGTFRLWETDSGKEVRRWRDNVTTSSLGYGNAFAIAFSRDGKTLVTRNFNGLRLYRTANGRPAKNLRTPDFWIAVALSPDGKTVAGAEGSFGARLQLWDGSTGKNLISSEGHQGGVLTAVFAPGGKTLATGSRDRTIRLWDPAGGKELRKLVGHSGAVAHLQFSSDGKHLVSASADNNDRTVSWWDVHTGKELRQFRGHASGVEALALSSDDKTLHVLDREGTLHTWDVTTGKETTTPGTRPAQAVFSPDGKQLAVLAFMRLQMQLTLGDPTRMAKARSLDIGGTFAKIRLAPGNRALLSMTYNRALRLWDLQSGKPLRWLRRVKSERAPSPQDVSLNAAPVFSPDGKTVALPGAGGVVHLLEVATGKERQVFRGQQGALSCVAFSPDGSRLLSGSEDGTALIWNIQRAPLARVELTAKALDTLWANLADTDAVKAYQAIRALTAAPAQAVPFFKKRVLPTSAVEEKRLAQLVTDLGSEKRDVRKNAEKELAKLGQAVRPTLLKALAAKPSLDVTQRIEALLRGMEDRELSTGEVRQVRSIEALEAIATAPARKLLAEWSRGAPGALLTEEARASLARLTTRARR